jgi:uncharacterized protein DUF5675
MELVLHRKPATDDAILGELFVEGRFECFSLERPGVEIPAGRYRVTITPSERFGRMLPLLDVPDRRGIRIHPLNWAQQSEGCIGVGQEHTVTSLEHSRLALQALQPKIAAALVYQDRVWITVTDAPPGLEA